jgi:hypothetical protein
MCQNEIRPTTFSVAPKYEISLKEFGGLGDVT